nr:dnaJ homolog subfamily C member 30 [Pogona vitticeps]
MLALSPPPPHTEVLSHWLSGAEVISRPVESRGVPPWRRLAAAGVPFDGVAMVSAAACVARRGASLLFGGRRAGLPALGFPAAGGHSGPGQDRGPASPRGSSPKGLYELLGGPLTATQAQIKTAYYKQSFLSHPDRNAGSEEAAERFTRVNEAYVVLGNVSLRKKYDRGLLSREDLQTARKPSGVEEERASRAPFKRTTQAYKPTSRPGGKPIFDFDLFYRAHYQEQLEREQFLRKRREEKKKMKEGQDMELKKELAETLVCLFLLGVVVATLGFL